MDEWTLSQALTNTIGSQRALDEVFKPHWDSWVTLKDFQKIKSSGFNVVRIPVGFWAFDTAGTPYISGAAAYLDKSIQWARKVGVKIVIDLHGAPGSQNGFDNSGQRVAKPKWQEGDNIKKTLRILGKIQEKYACAEYDDVVAAIEALNEPLDPVLNPEVTRDFHRRAFRNQRKTSDSRVFMGKVR